ncbi:hypothetical protein [Streptomyces atratus]
MHEEGYRLVRLVSQCPQELRVKPAVEAGAASLRSTVNRWRA